MLSRRAILAGLAAAPLMGTRALASAPLSVVATTGMVADAARAIGGDLVEVQALMGPGVDPHGYRQTRSDIVAMTRADLVLWNGLYLEAQLEDFMHSLTKRVPITAVAEAVPADQLLHHEDYENRSDPHIWMVPELWTHAVTATRDAMIAQRPEAADAFTANTEAYLAEIAKVGSYARDVLAQVPEQSRVLISAHDAFGYFGAAYGFEVKGIQGISTESEAGLERIRTLVDDIVTRKIGAVFVESSVSDRNIRALIEGAAAQGHEVKIGGELFSDAMGEPGTYEGTYIGMIDHNATMIAGALGVDVPLQGLNGKLGGKV
ncbi:Periplasmic zinc-binding protein TroA precursor [Pelagimonas phthalicica]|uniref:Periplasmic zinc-binding protein TroA n=1 Tax=Pelagimonas phthalicica TaxID=1037362 RepID=A0A238J8K3_9RHOB|nr:zinc ABC transporter substrate-binding protein [Pelagimonas phthalicica]TDS94756.1 manganese/zinc/iron transport system substrate-binding protein [Pelagimonas phthalicica]SMX26715.1 Periplasmic zinc-binding protein TroA precursor [Pelagimonas phthalicica]